MISIVGKIALAYLQNKKFLDKTGTKVLRGVLTVMAIVGAGIGVHSTIGGDEQMSQIQTMIMTKRRYKFQFMLFSLHAYSREIK